MECETAAKVKLVLLQVLGICPQSVDAVLGVKFQTSLLSNPVRTYVSGTCIRNTCTYLVPGAVRYARAILKINKRNI